MSAREYESIEPRIAGQDRNIKPRLGPKRRPVPKKPVNLTRDDWKRFADQLPDVFKHL